MTWPCTRNDHSVESLTEFMFIRIYSLEMARRPAPRMCKNERLAVATQAIRDMGGIQAAPAAKLIERFCRLLTGSTFLSHLVC